MFEKPSAFFFTEIKDDELIQLCREQIDEHIHCRIISGNPKDTIVSVRYDENGNWYVCRGSGYSFSKEYYANDLGWNVNDTHGTGIVMLAAIEVEKMKESQQEE